MNAVLLYIDYIQRITLFFKYIFLFINSPTLSIIIWNFIAKNSLISKKAALSNMIVGYLRIVFMPNKIIPFFTFVASILFLSKRNSSKYYSQKKHSFNNFVAFGNAFMVLCIYVSTFLAYLNLTYIELYTLCHP